MTIKERERKISEAVDDYNKRRREYIKEKGEKAKNGIPKANKTDYYRFARNEKDYRETLEFLNNFAKSKDYKVKKIGSKEVPLTVWNRAKKLRDREAEGRKQAFEIRKAVATKKGETLPKAEALIAKGRSLPRYGTEFDRFYKAVSKYGSRDYINIRAREYKSQFVKALVASGAENSDVGRDVIEMINKEKPSVFYLSRYGPSTLDISFLYNERDLEERLYRFKDDYNIWRDESNNEG